MTERLYDTARRPWGAIEQRCTWCRAVKPIGEFARNQRTGWITRECRACETERLACWARVDAQPAVIGRRHVNEDDTELVCKRCGRRRPREAFYAYSGGGRKILYRARCKQCMGAMANATDRRSERVRRSDRDRWLRKKYGLTLTDYERMLAAQGGRCAICRSDKPGGPTPDSAFHVDHCHETGRVRGLLCRRCNTAIGLLEESSGLFDAASRYLAATARAHLSA